MLACLCGVSSTTPACRRVLEDLDWASDEVLEDCLGAVWALRPQAHLLRNPTLLLQPQQPAAVPQDSLAESQPPDRSAAAAAADRAEVVAALLRLLRLLLPLLKECKRMNRASPPLLTMQHLLSSNLLGWVPPQHLSPFKFCLNLSANV